MRTSLFAAALSGLLTTATSAEDLTQRVAHCVGRLSAQMEHHWLFQDLDTSRIEHQRRALIDILDALTTPDTATRLLTRRIEAKMAHGSLLTRAAFAQDPRTATWAARHAAQQIALCDGIALSPALDSSAPIARVAGPADPISEPRQEAWRASQ